jgi:hypothetical protein
VSVSKPPGLTGESWIERQRRERVERGGFDNPRGPGKPDPAVDGPRVADA